MSSLGLTLKVPTLPLSPEDGYYLLDRESVQALIRRQELKQWWVAEVAGIHKTTLRRWLSGEIVKVRGSHVEKLASVLTVSPALIARPLTPVKRKE